MSHDYLLLLMPPMFWMVLFLVNETSDWPMTMMDVVGLHGKSCAKILVVQFRLMNLPFIKPEYLFLSKR